MLIKLAIVNYQNTLPFLWGIEHNLKFSPVNIELLKLHPAACFEALQNGIADIGIVPVGPIKDMIINKKWQIITDYCIGANKKVNSVLLLSHLPIKNLKKIYLDYQSRTSSRLLQIIVKNFYQYHHIEFMDSSPGYEKKISGETAGLVIGDRALQLKNEFPYVYDLAGEWYRFTQLPFVFAAWISIKPLDSEFTDWLNNSFQKGLSLINQKVEENQLFHLKTYLTEDIQYRLTDKYLQGLKKFWSML